MKFLIVDDRPEQLDILHRGLESSGHEAVEAGNGIEALAVLESESVDAVVSDILMPSMDGFRLCREIRKSGKRYSRLPVIVYTATYCSAADRELAKRVGADRYILKPVPTEALIEAVQEVLRQASDGETPRAMLAEDAHVLERYNGTHVRKLERRNAADQETLAALQSAHQNTLELNRQLEARLAQRTSALDAANRELDAFSFSVSHDLRAPLRTITGFSQLLEESAVQTLSADDRLLLGHIVGATTKMGQLIDGLLEYARTSRVELQPRQVDLNLLLDSALAQFHAEIESRRIDIKRGELPMVLGDPALLGQVFTNLIGNAVKFTGRREQATIEVGARSGRANEIVIFVGDNGAGFDLRYASRLFGVFQRLHRTEEFDGVGVGLAVAHRIVTRHGGTLWADAAVNRGATFYFGIPQPQQILLP